MSKEINENAPRKNNSRSFKNFADYWSFAKNLNEKQRENIIKNLPKPEQDLLRQSFEKGGWEDLLFRNQCDKILDLINEKFKIDLLFLRNMILSGKPQLVQKHFWEYSKANFDKLPYKHIAYIFDGIMESDSDDGYVLLEKYNQKDVISESEDKDNIEE